MSKSESTFDTELWVLIRAGPDGKAEIMEVMGNGAIGTCFQHFTWLYKYSAHDMHRPFSYCYVSALTAVRDTA